MWNPKAQGLFEGRMIPRVIIWSNSPLSIRNSSAVNRMGPVNVWCTTLWLASDSTARRRVSPGHPASDYTYMSEIDRSEWMPMELMVAASAWIKMVVSHSFEGSFFKSTSKPRHIKNWTPEMGCRTSATIDPQRKQRRRPKSRVSRCPPNERIVELFAACRLNANGGRQPLSRPGGVTLTSAPMSTRNRSLLDLFIIKATFWIMECGRSQDWLDPSFPCC